MNVASWIRVNIAAPSWCALCGVSLVGYFWRHFINSTTSDMDVCDKCAGGL